MLISRPRGRILAGAVVVAAGIAVVLGATRVAAVPASETGGPRSLTASSEATTPAIRARAAATWCGTPSESDATPNVVAGNPVHWIYAIPSDGQDRFSTFASLMQSDWEVIDAWWRGQDPTRAPRSDLAPFSCGNQLDLTVLRLPQTSAQLAARETPFDLVWDALDARGFTSRLTKYVVYFDGRVGNVDICGVGGTEPNGTGVAMLEAQACAGVERAQVVAHELAHALGAVPNGAPHECLPPDDGHTCDDTRDLMYPVTDGTPLSGLVLDPGRDDYYGHAGGWPDLQDSPWLVQLDRQTPLTLTIAGPGRIVADVPGLDCNQSCATTWNAGTRLTLTPQPGPNAKLVRWSGACAGASQCALVVGQGSSATAFFAPVTYRLAVRVAGRGAVRSSTGSIACPGRCASAVPSYRPLLLRATPAKGWRLRGWSGACRGKKPTCTLPMNAGAQARATFVRAR
jgi:hypothetical protein